MPLPISYPGITLPEKNPSPCVCPVIQLSLITHLGINEAMSYLYTVSKLLGHKDVRMTQRYAHHCPESLRGGIEVLDTISTKLAQSEEVGITPIILTS